jgi:arabinosyltransferase C
VPSPEPATTVTVKRVAPDLDPPEHPTDTDTDTPAAAQTEDADAEPASNGSPPAAATSAPPVAVRPEPPATAAPLTAEQAAPRAAADTAAPAAAAPVPPVGRSPRWLRWLAAGLGTLSAGLAIAVPFLPVVERTATISWPQGPSTAAVSAPLVAYQPLRLHATVPCALARAARPSPTDPRTLFATTPAGSERGAEAGMTLQTSAAQPGGILVALSSAGRELARVALPASGDCAIEVNSDANATTLAIGGATTTVDGDVRPQVVGVYSELPYGVPTDGLAVRIQTDTRFQTSAHLYKTVATGLAVLALIGCLFALHALDRRAGRRHLRFAPRGWWRPTWQDAAVFTTLGVWLFVGALTSDDGYIETMARARSDSGYVGNYYRWFDVPEAPFGWFYETYALWVRVSTEGPWLRLPAALMGAACWLLISREVLPRLGREVRRSRAAGWAAAAMLLCFWLPYNNGLRPEPVIALGSLLTLCAVERTVATRRLLPAALGLVVAGFTCAATPSGLIAVVPFVVAARPLVQLVRRRAQAEGWLAVLAPVAACGFIVLVAVFADQSFAAVAEATRVRTAIGPTLSWYEEYQRYSQLFDPGAGGSLARRFPVFVLLLCVGTCLVVLLRRGGIPGAALGPSRRLIGTAAVSLMAISLTPTKWTHHFGAFAAIGAALAALTALATCESVLRSRRNRAAFVAALFFLTAFAFTGGNAWFYVSGFGVPWFDKPPSFHGHPFSTPLLALGFVALVVAAVEHLRFNPDAPVPPRPERSRRALRLGSAPLALFCGVMVLASLASMAKGIQKQRDSYSLGVSNVKELSGGCGLSDQVLVEPRPLDGVLPPLAGFPADAQGFKRGALPDRITDSDAGRNMPYGFGGDGAPVWGSYADAGQTVGTLRTGWYELPAPARAGQVPVVVAVAGTLGAATTVDLEFASAGRVVDTITLADMPENALREDPLGWRNLRTLLTGRPAAGADAVRVVAKDSSLREWLAVSTPRAPRLTKMIDLIGQQPVYLHWSVGFVHPCLQPFQVRNGIAQLPAYAISGITGDLPGALGWASAEAGGPNGWLDLSARQPELPAYLENDWNRDWGHLYRVEPLESGMTPATVTAGEQRHDGLFSPGPMRRLPPGTDPITKR